MTFSQTVGPLSITTADDGRILLVDETGGGIWYESEADLNAQLALPFATEMVREIIKRIGLGQCQINGGNYRNLNGLTMTMNLTIDAAAAPQITVG